MRDHTKLKAFQLADEFAIMVYRATRGFPSDERFGLTAQLRRSAVSVASNIVEGCARPTEADYLHFLGIAFASLRESEYQLSLSNRLGFLPEEDFKKLQSHGISTSKVLSALIRSLRPQRRTAEQSKA